MEGKVFLILKASLSRENIRTFFKKTFCSTIRRPLGPPFDLPYKYLLVYLENISLSKSLRSSLRTSPTSLLLWEDFLTVCEFFWSSARRLFGFIRISSPSNFLWEELLVFHEKTFWSHVTRSSILPWEHCLVFNEKTLCSSMRKACGLLWEHILVFYGKILPAFYEKTFQTSMRRSSSLIWKDPQVF